MKILLPLLLTILPYCLLAQEDSEQNSQYTIDPETSKASTSEVGRVILLKGDVFKLKGGEEKEIKLVKSHSIVEGDVIKTKANSIVKIKMLDDTMISLGPNSIYQFKEFKFKNPSDRQSTMGLLVGQMRAHFVNKAKNPDDLKIKTRASSMGIRGTELVANVHPLESGKMVTEVALLSGKMDVTNNNSGATKSILPKDHLITITDSKGVQTYDEGVLKLNAEIYDRLIAKAGLDEVNVFLDFYKSESVTGRGPSSIGRAIMEDNDSSSDEGTPSFNYKSHKEKLKMLNRIHDEYNQDY